VFWVVIIWLLCAVQIVCAVRSLVERRPVGAIRWRTKRRATTDDYRVSAILSGMLGVFWAFMGAYNVTQRFVWLQTAGICMGVGLVALIGVGAWQERGGDR
jgi:hypothetical protein